MNEENPMMLTAAVGRPPRMMRSTDRTTGWIDSPQRRRAALFAVKGAHTLIFFALSAGVLETVRAGVSKRPSRATAPAIAATIGEGIVLLASDNRCPLTGLAEDLGAADGRVSDIFLPGWFARRIPSIFATLFGFGLGRLLEAQAAAQPQPRRTGSGLR
jgi:hypothetical protein